MLSCTDSAGYTPLSEQQSPARQPQPQQAGGAGSSVGPVGDLSRSPSAVSSDGTRKVHAKGGSGKVTIKPASSARANPKKGARQGKRGSSVCPAPSAPPDPGQSQQTDRRGSAESVHPPGTVVSATHCRDGLLSVLPDRATRAQPLGLGAPLAGRAVDLAGDPAWAYPGPSASLVSGSSDLIRCSGIPISQAAADSSSDTPRGRPSKKKGKKKKKSDRRSRESSPSSGDSSSRSRRSKRCKGEDVVSRGEFLQAFQSISASISALASRQTDSVTQQSEPVVRAQTPLIVGHGWVAQGQRDLPHTISRAPASPPALSLHPSMSIVSEEFAQPQAHSSGQPASVAAPAAARDFSGSPLPSHSSDGSADDEGVAQLQRLSIAETELRLVQRDMIRVLQFPPEQEPPQPEHKSFKRKTGVAVSGDRVFPEIPLDQVCAEKISGVMSPTNKWRAYPNRARDYYHFPKPDLEKFFATPTLSDATKDKLVADEGRPAAKRPFVDKTRCTLEDTLKKLDAASRHGMAAASFLLLLTEYLVSGCEEETAIPPDMLTAAFHCLDNGLQSVLSQFARVAALATSVRRGNVLDALFLPSQGARKRLEALPLLGNDLFAGKFEDFMQAEAKRLKATEKINLKRPPTPTPKSSRGRGKPSYVIPRRSPLGAPTRGSFRGRTTTSPSARPTQSQPATSWQPATTWRQQPKPGRGYLTPGPRFTGARRK